VDLTSLTPPVTNMYIAIYRVYRNNKGVSGGNGVQSVKRLSAGEI
jgi:hypothetical protein